MPQEKLSDNEDAQNVHTNALWQIATVMVTAQAETRSGKLGQATGLRKAMSALSHAQLSHWRLLMEQRCQYPGCVFLQETVS